MANVLVVAHHTRSEVAPLLAQLRGALTKGGHHLWLCRADADAHGLGELASDRDASDADLVVVLGGDGTVLRAVSMLNGAPVPVLGVNVGVLGYLTEVGIGRAIEAVGTALTGRADKDFIVDQRMLLQVTVSKEGQPATSWRALNEAVLEKQQSGHTVWIDVTVNHELFERYSADGVIVGEQNSGLVRGHGFVLRQKSLKGDDGAHPQTAAGATLQREAAAQHFHPLAQAQQPQPQTRLAAGRHRRVPAAPCSDGPTPTPEGGTR